jgi:DNA polymerase-3 subunit delta'
MPSNRFSGLADQPRVAAFFERAVAEGRVSHAYLFTGGDTDGMDEAARLLAEAVVVSDEDAGRFETASYPDFHAYEPASYVGYLADQVREIIDTASLTPIRGRGKFFVLREADRLYGTAANALLKTLEEPADDVTFVLCAKDADSVLPTLVSRCQVVPFSNVDGSVACARVAKTAGVSEDDARFALEFCTGPRDALGYFGSPERQAVVSDAMDLLGDVRRIDAWECVKRADAIAKAELARSAELKRRQEEDLERYTDFLSATAKKELEKRHKREVSAFERSCVREPVAAMQAALRDALATREGGAELGIGGVEARADADSWTSSEIMGALESCAEGLDNLRHAVTIELALEALVLKIRETVCR